MYRSHVPEPDPLSSYFRYQHASLQSAAHSNTPFADLLDISTYGIFIAPCTLVNVYVFAAPPHLANASTTSIALSSFPNILMLHMLKCK
ncbi:hypothetical protein DPMN_146411 [Dreissena polymorpha]|uniref:Uncharacterized protein n=1 Tax=Dreissena polymorpha TaxID=45954 RepID=A0A9D4F5V7_DREPO|nr:hypothetical protein DPMN_146411 [Dreissena polymorpha]